MFVPLFLALAAAPATTAAPLLIEAAAPERDRPDVPEPRHGGITPYENHPLSQPHANSDDRMFPDIAIGALSIAGDTLYVQVMNKGRSRTQVPVEVLAKADVGGVRSELVEGRTEPLRAGESRWVALRGFSFKTAATRPAVFALENAGTVSALARLMPSSAGTLDRSGEGCGDCTTETDEANNGLTASGDALKHGKPR